MTNAQVQREVVIDASALDLLVRDFFTANLFMSFGCPKRLATRMANQFKEFGNVRQPVVPSAWFAVRRYPALTVRVFARTNPDARAIESVRGVGVASRPYLRAVMEEVWKIMK